MSEEIKAIDGVIVIPGTNISGKAAEEAEKAENDTGQGGVLGLFQGMADRDKPVLPKELVAEMDAAGVEKGVISSESEWHRDWIKDAIKQYPGKFVPATVINPVEKGIMNEIRRVKSWIDEIGVQIIRVAGFRLGVPCTDHRLFPFYTMAIEYDLKVHINVGYPGPAGIARNQDPLHVDELCYYLPELKVVQTHGGVAHPYVEIAIQNVIKYPNCYLMTNASRPKYFPTEFIQHLNTRAQDKVIWGTEYPLVTFQRSLDDIKELPLREHVLPKYLRENILRLVKFE